MERRKFRRTPVNKKTLVLVVSFIVVANSSLLGQKPSPGKTSRPATVASAPKSNEFTNADVIKLVKEGFSESFVVTSIKSATTKSFNLSTAAIVELKQAGVSERIITAMMGADVPPPSPAPITQAAPATVPAPSNLQVSLAAPATKSVEGREAGIYLDQGDNNLTMLLPSTFTGAKSGGWLKSAVTYGIAKSNWKVVVRSAKAAQRLQESNPVFYFYFENQGSGLSGSSFAGPYSAAASNPNEFVLAKMDQKRDERELIVAEGNIAGMRTGTRSKDTIPVKVEQVSPGVFKVTPEVDLEPGEYCFYNASGVAGMIAANSGRIFDFGLDSKLSASK